MATYWLTETKFSKKNYYSDYITNPKKRIQTGDASILGRIGGRPMLMLTKKCVTAENLF